MVTISILIKSKERHLTDREISMVANTISISRNIVKGKSRSDMPNINHYILRYIRHTKNCLQCNNKVMEIINAKRK